jgi:hypothetical protein
LTEKSGNIALADFVELEWPDPPKEPSCPLDMLEEAMLKTLDEVEDMKGKLIAQDKEMGRMKAEHQKVSNDLSALEEQRSSLRKEMEDGQGKVNKTLSAKELALKPDMSGKVNEGVEVFGPSGSEEEVTEQPVQSEQKKDLKQNIKTNTYFPAPPLPVNPLVGVPMYQHSTQNCGFQRLLHNSPYFCKCMCVCVCVCYYHSPKCKMLKEIIFLDILLCSHVIRHLSKFGLFLLLLIPQHAWFYETVIKGCTY